MYPDERPSEEYATAKEVRKSRLPLTEQEKCIAELHETISMLTNRLSAVLTPVPERDPSAKEARADGPIMSELANQLESNNYGIRKATKKLEVIMDRLEV